MRVEPARGQKGKGRTQCGLIPPPPQKHKKIPTQHLVEEHHKGVVGVGNFEVVLAAEEGLCLRDEFGELLLELGRGDVLVGHGLYRCKKTAIENFIHKLYCLKVCVAYFFSRNKNKCGLYHNMRQLRIIFVFFTN